MAEGGGSKSDQLREVERREKKQVNLYWTAMKVLLDHQGTEEHFILNFVIIWCSS